MSLDVKSMNQKMRSLIFLMDVDRSRRCRWAYVSLASTFAGVKSVQRVPMFDGGNYKGTPTVKYTNQIQGNQQLVQ